MRIRTADNKESYALLTTNHPSSSYGQQVLVLDDGAVLGRGDMAGVQILKASGDEIDALIKWLAPKPAP